MIRKICEAYQCLPTDVEKLTQDQFLILVLPEKELERQGKFITGSLDELIAWGVVKLPPEKKEKEA